MPLESRGTPIHDIENPFKSVLELPDDSLITYGIAPDNLIRPEVSCQSGVCVGDVLDGLDVLRLAVVHMTRDQREVGSVPSTELHESIRTSIMGVGDRVDPVAHMCVWALRVRWVYPVHVASRYGRMARYCGGV